MYMLQDVTKSARAGNSFTQEGSDASSSLVLFPVNTGTSGLLSNVKIIFCTRRDERPRDATLAPIP
jgi:hypothetical protein